MQRELYSVARFQIGRTSTNHKWQVQSRTLNARISGYSHKSLNLRFSDRSNFAKSASRSKVLHKTIEKIQSIGICLFKFEW